MLGWIFFIDAGDFTRLSGGREKKCPGVRLALNAGELEALVFKSFIEIRYAQYVENMKPIRVW